MPCSCIVIYPNEVLISMFWEGREFWAGETHPSEPAVCPWDLISCYERRNKDKPNRAVCEDPHVSTPHPVTGKAARSSCHFSAKLFAKSEPLTAPKPFLVPPESLPCAPCKNTPRGDWTCPMNDPLFIIIEPSLFPSRLRIMGWSSS